MQDNKTPPVWIGDSRIAIASSSSIDHGTVDLDKGEMSFPIFSCPDLGKLDAIVQADQRDLKTLTALAAEVGEEALPEYLITYLRSDLHANPGTLAIHTASSVAGYGKSADVDAISRAKGFLGAPQLEEDRFPNTRHHIKIMHNGKGRARVFYKNRGGAQFVQNQAV